MFERGDLPAESGRVNHRKLTINFKWLWRGNLTPALSKPPEECRAGRTQRRPASPFADPPVPLSAEPALSDCMFSILRTELLSSQAEMEFDSHASVMSVHINLPRIGECVERILRPSSANAERRDFHNYIIPPNFSALE